MKAAALKLVEGDTGALTLMVQDPMSKDWIIVGDVSSDWWTTDSFGQMIKSVTGTYVATEAEDV
jgi:hypothetical protein